MQALNKFMSADTPSPSPPKKQTFQAPPKPPTRAADLMMDIIRQEDEAKPVRVYLRDIGRELTYV